MPFSVFADGLGDPDERGQSGAAGLGAPPIEQLAGVAGVQVADEDSAGCLFEAVGAPYVPAAATEFAQRGGLFVAEVLVPAPPAGVTDLTASSTSVASSQPAAA